MRRLVLAGVAGLLVFAPPAVAGELRAGAAVVDATYHVGPSAGQYSHTRGESLTGSLLDQEIPDPSEIDDPAAEFGEFDPFLQQTKNQASYGIQSRLTTRAIVVQEAGGQKVAIVKTDLYIPQDMLRRRAVELLRRGTSGIGTENLVFAVSHNHSSPYYTSTAWGAWAFQDVFDVRFWEYAARTIASAVERAAAAAVPVRMTAGQVDFDKLARHSFGPARADDGTPAGYPESETDPALSVVRFDALATGRPVAVLGNWSVHPEFLDGNGLISADYLGPLERFVDREVGAPLIWTQRAVGTAEPERSTYHDVHERLEFTHREYGQAEYGARLLADALIGLHRDLGSQGARTRVPWTADAPLRVDDRWFPGPISHPVPTVSNCRTDTALGGDPQLPIVGLPDCTSLPVVEDLGVDPGLSTAQLGALGIPLPSNYSFPSYSGLQETLGVHLQVVRIGDLVLPVCSCEQWYDQARNIETRLNRTPDDEWLGYDWSAQCAPAGGGTWTCPNASGPVSDEAFRRMRAQVRNPANGWNDPVAGQPGRGLLAETEPPDPDDILGNYTHDDTDDHGCREDLSDADAPCVQTQAYADRHGYDLVVPIALANDYNGYIATYREYQRGDHYRKALTAFGPHSSDYLATRLVDMAHALKGDANARARLDAEPLAAKEIADQAHADVKAATLGAVAETAIPAYEALLPDDAGPPAVVAQPATAVERFGAVSVRWRGGSNYTDDPDVVVERRTPAGTWERYADGSGEVPVTVRYPDFAETFSFLAATYSWEWTATFEAFVSRVDSTRPDGTRERATPAGTYRFRIRGLRRASRAARPYELVSAPFEVRPWRGITVGAVRADPDGRASVALGPNGIRTGTDMRNGATRSGFVGPIDYPDSYAGGPRFIDPARGVVRDPAAPDDPTRWEWYCEACSFRPWLDAGDAETVTFQVAGPTGCTTVAGERAGERWRTARPLTAGETARVAPGGAVDPYGNVNGAASGPPLPGCPADPPPPGAAGPGATTPAPAPSCTIAGVVRLGVTVLGRTVC